MRIFFNAIIFFIIPTLLFSQDWKKVKIESGEIFSVACPDKYNCFAFNQNKVDYGPEIFKSTNQGKTWKIIYHHNQEKSPEVVLLNGYIGAAPDSKHIYIAWWDVPAISISNDGGYTFSKTILDSEQLYDRHLHEFTMLNLNYGFIRADYGSYITKDCWKTFQNISDNFYFKPQYPIFLDSNTIICVMSFFNSEVRGYRYMKYHINENKLDTIYHFGYEPITGHFIYMVKLYFLNDSVGFACGYAKTGIGETRNGILFRTKDGGYSWDLIFTENTIPNFGFNDIKFYDDLRGVLIGYLGKIFFTMDGGETWIRSFLPEEYDYQLAQIMYVTWAGKYPIIGTYGLGIFRYEGDFFEFPPETILPVIQADDCDFSNKDIQNQDSLVKKVRINNISDTLDLIITGYSNLSESAFWTNLPVINTQNPLLIKPEKYYEYDVYFKPNEVRKYNDSIIFFSNSKEIDSITYIMGEGIAKPIIKAEDFNFGKFNIKDTIKTVQKIKITNISSYSDLLISGFSNLKESAFQNEFVWLDSMNYITVKPLEYFELPVSFKPNETRYYIDKIVVYSNAVGQDSIIVLEGEGIDDTTSVVDNNSIVNQIILSPNPASDYIEITVGANGRSPQQDEQIQIYDVYGEQMPIGAGYEPALTETLRIYISSFPDGIYFLRIGDEVREFVVIK